MRSGTTLGVIAAFSALTLAALSRAWGSVSAAPTQAIQSAADKEPPGYTTHIEPLLKARCLACHTSTGKMGGLVMESYESLLKGGVHGPIFVPGKSSESRIVLMLEGKVQPRMPFGGEPLDPRDISLIKAWIDAGAKGPTGRETAPLAAAPKLAIPEVKPQVPVVSPVGALAFSPDGKLVAVGGYQEVRLMDAANGKIVAAFSGHADLVRALAFSPDGTKLAAAGGQPARSGEIKIWDVRSHELLRTIEGHNDCIYSVAASPDGKMLATGSYDKMVKLWDFSTGKELKNLKDHIDAVFAVAFSPDGKRLASGSQDRTVKIWDVAAGQRVYTLSEALDSINTAAFSPSGSQLASAGVDKQIRVYNLGEKSGSLAVSMIAHEDTILRVVYSPDGKTLISTSADRTIRVWEAPTISAIKVLEKQPDWVEALSVSPDGKWLAAGRYDGTVSIYQLGTYKQVLGPIEAFETFQPAPSAEKKVGASRRLAPTPEEQRAAR